MRAPTASCWAACCCVLCCACVQATMLGLFPKLTVQHTRGGKAGQVYMPEVNWSLMVLTVAVTAGFRSTDRLKEAYGAYNVTCTQNRFAKLRPSQLEACSAGQPPQTQPLMLALRCCAIHHHELCNQLGSDEQSSAACTGNPSAARPSQLLFAAMRCTALSQGLVFCS
jgi:hypothetical protein